MTSASAPDHEIITVTPDMVELRQQCYDIRVAVFVDEQGQLTYRSWSASTHSYHQASLSMRNLTSDSYKRPFLLNMATLTKT